MAGVRVGHAGGQPDSLSVKGDAGEANLELVMRLQERGLAAPSTTRVGGRQVIRAAIFNHRTTEADIDGFFQDALAIATELRAGS